jgi:hypothetical protein
MTNNERINQMSAQEKANWIELLQMDNCSCCAHYKMSKYKIVRCEIEHGQDISDCINGRIEWLEAEADDGEEE